MKVIAVILATLVLIESPFPAWASASCPAIERLNEISSRQARVDRETEFGRWYDSSERTTYNQSRLALRWILNGSKYQRPDPFGLTAIERFAIEIYTGQDYDQLNTALWKCSDSLLSLQPAISVLSAALAKLPPYHGKVERYITVPLEAVTNHQVGNIVEYPAFTSTTAGGIIYPGNIKLSIISHSGRSVRGYSVNKQEKEVLFDRGSRFRILERTDDFPQTVITMEQVH